MTYPCPVCGVGTVADEVRKNYPTKLFGSIEFIVPRATVGECSKCNEAFLNIAEGCATEVGEYWKKNAEDPTPCIVGITRDEGCIEFAFRGCLLVLPTGRLKLLLEEAV